MPPSFRRISSTERLLSALELDCVTFDPDASQGSVMGRWHGLGAAMPGAWWVFGGLVAAQATIAAAASAPGFVPRMTSIRFLRQAEPGCTIEHAVVRTADANTFADRTVTASVDGSPIAVVTVMLHRPDDTPLGFHRPMPAAAPQVPVNEVAGFEFVDLCDPPMMARATASSEMQLWMRVPGVDRSQPVLNVAALTMAADLFVTQSAWRPIDGYAIRDVDKVMSWGLSLSVWYHQPVTFDDWHLAVIDTPVAGAGRSLGQTHWYDTAGDLVASTVLDSVMRVRRETQAAGTAEATDAAN